MRSFSILSVCAAALVFGGGCGLIVQRPPPLEVDRTIVNAAEIAQSLKNDFAVKQVRPAERAGSPIQNDIRPAEKRPDEARAIPNCSSLEISDEPISFSPADAGTTEQVRKEQSWFEKNWPWLSWAVLALICIVMYFADKCSEKWGIPSKETMIRMSYYFTRCLPLTQRTIYAGVRTQYLRIKSQKANGKDSPGRGE